ncbi:MAG: hypothetical protein IT285_03445, partial [Bdellovibrionales bacterium]|nr:hypothetical protein [Bdellovibrionales bacterium]
MTQPSRSARLNASLVRLHRELFDRGLAREAEALYRELKRGRTDRPNLALLADAANRLSRPDEAIALLSRIVRPPGKVARVPRGGVATPFEAAVYG